MSEGELTVGEAMPPDIQAHMVVLCRHLAAGLSLQEACDKYKRVRFDEVVAWISLYPGAREMMDTTRPDVHRMFVHTLEHVAKPLMHGRDAVAAAKLHCDNLKWLLEREDRERYGNKPMDVSVSVDLVTPYALANARLDAMGVFAKPLVIDVPVVEKQDVVEDPFAED